MTKSSTIQLKPSKQPVLFVSDVHLHPEKPGLSALFLDFLNTKARNSQALFILGDLFDVWLGDDVIESFEHGWSKHFLALSQSGVKIYFMAGNRDFLLSKKYATQSGLALISDPTILEFMHQKILLTHGDLLCTKDSLYQFYRKLAQHPITKYIFLKCPRRFRHHIAQKLRLNSKSYQKNQSLEKLDATEAGVKFMIRHIDTTAIVHGHVHRPKHYQHTINGAKIDRYVLGSWHDKGSYIELENNQYTILEF